MTVSSIVLSILLLCSIGGNVYLGVTRNTVTKNYTRVEQNMKAYTSSGARSEAINITMLDNKVKWAGLFYTNTIFNEYKDAVLFRSTLANWQKGFTSITPVFSGRKGKYYESVSYDLYYPINLSETNYTSTLVSNFVSVTNYGSDTNGYAELTNGW
jgi:hypothetical protein